MRRTSSILTLVLLGSGLFASARVGEDARKSFPLSPGTFWIYRGLVRSSEQGSTVGKVASVTWKMSVVRVIERGGVSAAVVSGFPTDLDWSDGQATPQLSILLITPDGKIYLKGEWDTQSLRDQIDNPRFPLQQLVDVDDWILQLPLAEGKKFCDEEAAQREDSQYCWITGPAHPASLSAVKGIASGARTAYEVDYSTNPDDTEIEFVEGVGITSYAYHHHGTIAETELHLVEFHPGESAAR